MREEGEEKVEGGVEGVAEGGGGRGRGMRRTAEGKVRDGDGASAGGGSDMLKERWAGRRVAADHGVMS